MRHLPIFLVSFLAGCLAASADVGSTSQALATGDDGLDLLTTHADGVRWRAGHSESANHSSPAIEPNRTFHIGWNTSDSGMPIVASEPSWRFTLESDFEANPGGDHYSEAHLQWTTAAGLNLRPFSLSINRTQRSIVGTLFRGRFTVWANNSPSQVLDILPGTGRQNVVIGYPGVNGIGATLVAAKNGVPAVEQYGTDRVIEIARVDTANVLHFGARASAVRFDAPRPVATTCEELGQALDDLGLVDWQP